MKTKTLIGIAVASTFGWSAATFAGAGHEVVTPFSPNESGEVLTQVHSQDRIAKGHVALGDAGIYSDYYLVSLAPIDAWDYYVIDTDPLSAGEDVYFLTPSYDVVWVSGDMFPDSSMGILESGD